MEWTSENVVKAISSGIRTLSGRPLQDLLPLIVEIRHVDQQLSDLVNAIEPESHQDGGQVFTVGSQIPDAQEGAPSESLQGGVGIHESAFGFSEVEELFHAASEQIQAIESSFQTLASSPFDWLSRDERLLHLQPIFAILQSSRSRENTLGERIILLCACMSLANDFRKFEIHVSGQAKQDALLSNTLAGSKLSVQKLEKNFRSFHNSLNAPWLDYKRLDAGVRLGTKLNVVTAIGRRTPLGGCLGLILGLETKRLSRLPYKRFSLIEFELQFQGHTQDYATLLSFAQSFGQWWEDCQAAYGNRFEKLGVHVDGSTVIPRLAPPTAVQSSRDENHVQGYHFTEPVDWELHSDCIG